MPHSRKYQAICTVEGNSKNIFILLSFHVCVCPSRLTIAIVNTLYLFSLSKRPYGSERNMWKKNAHISFLICSIYFFFCQFLLNLFHLYVATYFPTVPLYCLLRNFNVFSEQFELILTNHSSTIHLPALSNSTSKKILRLLKHSYGSHYHMTLRKVYSIQIRDLAKGKSNFLYELKHSSPLSIPFVS